MSSPRHSPPPSAAAPKPKGILKNAGDRRPSQGGPALGPEDDVNGKLQWDESNLTLHEIEREQQEARMVIDEPKTPFVHGTSLAPVGDEDNFALDDAPSSGHSSRRGSTVQQVAANTAANAGRASGGSLSGVPSLGIDVGLDDVAKRNKESFLDADGFGSGPSSARTTSRSPSFSLPPKSPSSRRSSSRSATTGVADDQRSGIRQEVHDMDVDATNDGAIEEEDSDPETQAKHAAFAAKRNQHYGNEAEAMKVAAALAARDDDDDDDDQEDAGLPSIPTMPNGTTAQ